MNDSKLDRRQVLGATAAALATPVIAQGASPAPDWAAVGRALGKDGAVQQPGDVYRVGLPRTDLSVTLDGVQLKPTLALGSWLAFRQMGGQAMVMGDLVLTHGEINPVMSALVENGIEISALHNHLLRSTPPTMYMHVAGRGDAIALATTLHRALALSRTPFPAPGSAAPPAAAAPGLDLNAAALDGTLGAKGKGNGGVYQFSIPRAQATKDSGMDVPEAMGSANAINFQPTGGGKAAITGDLVLIASEVGPVMRALRAGGVEVTALHSHMLNDQPRLFFMHFWANDDAQKLGRALRTALNLTKVRKA